MLVLLFVVVVDDVSEPAGAFDEAGMDESGAVAGVVVVVVLVVVSDDAVVTDGSGFFSQAPSPKAKPAASITARAVR